MIMSPRYRNRNVARGPEIDKWLAARVVGALDIARDFAQLVAEVALWAGRPDEALEEVRPLLGRLEGAGWVILCG